MKCKIKFYTLKYVIRITEINILKQTKGDSWYIPIKEDSESSLLSLFLQSTQSILSEISEGLHRKDRTTKEILTFKGN